MSNHEHDHTEDMIELDLDENDIEGSKQECRRVIQKWIDDRDSTVVIIRGIGNSIGEFAGEIRSKANVLQLCQAIWVKDTRIFLPNQEDSLFQEKPNPPWCAVVIGFHGIPTECMNVNWNSRKIGRTIRKVMRGEGSGGNV